MIATQINSKPELLISEGGLSGGIKFKYGPIMHFPKGTKVWILDGLRHREDGPAIVMPNGFKFWYINDRLHREDGPAIERPSGSYVYFYNGKRIDMNNVYNQKRYPELYKDYLVRSIMDN